MSINKTSLIEIVKANTGSTNKAARETVEALLDAVITTVAEGEKVQIIGFGTFEARKRAAREGRNPQTGEVLKIEATTVPAFKAGKAFKEAVKK